jgi:hypothetical protein
MVLSTDTPSAGDLPVFFTVITKLAVEPMLISAGTAVSTEMAGPAAEMFIRVAESCPRRAATAENNRTMLKTEVLVFMEITFLYLLSR